jgi:lysophospholipase L1-like esterase
MITPAPDRTRGSVPSLVLAVLDALFLLALLLAPALWMATEIRIPLTGARAVLRWKAAWLAVPPAILALRFAARAVLGRGSVPPRGFLDGSIPRKLCLAIASTFAFFLVVEQALERIGFEHKLPPIVIRGGEGEPADDSAGMVPDEELRWKFRPGGLFRGRRINSLGFLDREVNPVKAPGAIRVICMGDSCSAQGSPPYSGFLNTLLTNAPPTAERWEAFNMAVHGYSSVQGLRLFQLKGPALHPDVVTLYYGWNDHWQGGRLPDVLRMAVRSNRFRAAVLRLLGNKRFGQLLLKHLAPRAGPAQSQKYDGYRVPREDYRSTLAEFVAEIRAAGAVPILITAPRARALTPALVKNKQAISMEQVTGAHDDYADITREVAASLNVPLLDLHRMMDGEESAPLFEPDGIHLVKDGRRLIARELYARLREVAASEEWRLRKGSRPLGHGRDSSLRSE